MSKLNLEFVVSLFFLVIFFVFFLIKFQNLILFVLITSIKLIRILFFTIVNTYWHSRFIKSTFSLIILELVSAGVEIMSKLNLEFVVFLIFLVIFLVFFLIKFQNLILFLLITSIKLIRILFSP